MPIQIMPLFVYTTTRKRFVIFKCRYFKLRWNSTALSQSNCRKFSCSSIKNEIQPCKSTAFYMYWCKKSNKMLCFIWYIETQRHVEKMRYRAATLKVSGYQMKNSAECWIKKLKLRKIYKLTCLYLLHWINHYPEDKY